MKTTIGTRKSFSLLLNFLIFRLKTDARDNRGVGQYFFFTGTTLLLKGFLKDSLSHLKNKDTGNTLLAEKILIHDFGNVAVYVTLHNTVNGNGSSQVGSLKEGSWQEEVDTKISFHVSYCLSHCHKVIKKISNTDIVWFVLYHYTRFPR